MDKSRNLINKIRNRAKEDKFIIIKLLRTSMARAISALGTFVFNFTLARYLGISDYGNFMLAYSIIVGLGFLVQFGMPNAIMRFASIMYVENKFGQIKKLQKDVFLICMISGGILGVIFYFAHPFLAHTFFKNADIGSMFVFFSIALPFYSYLTVQSAFLKAFKRPEIAPFIEIGLTTFMTGVLVILLSVIGIEPTGAKASICFLFSNVIVFYSGFTLLNRIIRKSEGEKIYKLDGYAGFYSTLPDYAASSITGYILKFSPTIILGALATSKDVGLFSLANSIAFVINFVLWIVSTVYAPHFANLYNENKIRELRRLLKSSIMYMLVIAIPVFTVLFCFPSFILSFFGKEFIEAKVGLMLMAFAQLLNVSTGSVLFLLNMTGHQKTLRNITFITAFISIITSLVLVPTYGYMGAAISASIGLLIQNISAFHYVNKKIGLNILNFNKSV